jgi:hypothetical protein
VIEERWHTWWLHDTCLRPYYLLTAAERVEMRELLEPVLACLPIVVVDIGAVPGQ